MYALKQRVMTCMGLGTVEGFERFDGKGFSAEPSLTDVEGSDSRVIVSLDYPKKWIGATAEFPHPYCYRKDLYPVTGMQLMQLPPTARDDGPAATLQITCLGCSAFKPYREARLAGWSFNLSGVPLQAYYCEKCTRAVLKEQGHA